MEPALLAQNGSLFLTRPTLATYMARRSDLEAAAADLFAAVLAGHVTIGIGNRYPLAEAARAQTELAARSTVGSGVLVP